MQYAVETITPQKAREYFNTSQGEGKKFRPISQQFVHSYADTMKRGRWMENGEPIVFDTNGDLTNGCHRMLAVEEAGIPVRFLVVRGVDPEAFTTYDNGRHRTVGQLLCMQGVKNYNLVGSIVIANERLIRSNRLYENNSSNGAGNHGGGPASLKRTNDDNYMNYRRDPNGFNDAGSFTTKLLSRCRILSGQWTGGLYYYLTHSGGYPKEEVEPFFDALFSIDTSDIPVVNLLRTRITKAALSGQKLKADMLFALIAKTWNAYITGRELKKLAYDPQKELEYPKLILK